MGSPTAFIKREKDAFNYEKDRYILLPTSGSFAGSALVRTSTFFIGKGDKINISFETRLKNNYSGAGSSIVAYALLRGDNNTYYTLDGTSNVDNNGNWFASNSTFTLTTHAIHHEFAATDLKTDWASTSVDSKAAPVSGTVQLVFLEYSNASYPNETHIKGLNIEYFPFIKESYVPALGDYNYFEQNGKINKSIDETVGISDAPKKIIKGAIFINEQLPTPQWYRLNVSEQRRFMELMTMLRYAATFRQSMKIEGTLKGLSLLHNTDTNIPFGFLPQYSFTDIPNTSDSRYILTLLETSYVTAESHAVFVEIKLNQSIDFDKYEFQYLFK
jgi:hypothetical protein